MSPKETTSRASPLYRGLALLIPILYVLLGFAYNVQVPLWESPDELAHFAYVRHLVEERSFPVMREGELGEAHQPPLYYLVAALWTLPTDLQDQTGAARVNPEFMHGSQGGRDVNAVLHDHAQERFPYRGVAKALHLVRAASTLFGLGAVLMTQATARTLFPRERTLHILAPALVALNPQFLFITASANNDALLAFVAAGMIWQTARGLHKLKEGPLPLAEGVALGLWGSTILLTKMTGLAVIAAAFALLGFEGLRRRRLPSLLKALLLAVGMMLLASGWWFLRNWRLYGDPLGYTVYRQVFRVNVRDTPMPLSELPAFFRVQLRSFWGVFGWMNVHPPGWYHSLFLSLTGVGLLGWLARLVRRRGESSWYLNLAPLFVLGAHELYLLLIVRTADFSMWQGRYLFAAMAPIGLLLAGGLLTWVPPRGKMAATAVLCASLLALALYVPPSIIRPAYRSYAPAATTEIDRRLDVVFGEAFRLRGYDLERNALKVDVTLHWEALATPDFDYSVFVHLLDSDGELIGQQDHAPGAHRNHPPTTWDPGEQIADRHRIALLRAPQGSLTLRVGVYNWATGDRLAIDTPAEFAGQDYLTIDAGERESTPLSAIWYLVGGGALLVAAALAWWLHRRLRR